MTDIEFIVVSVLGSAALVAMMVATARVNRSLSDGLRHKWKYHNPYDRTCSRCMRHEVKHCRDLSSWNRDWWEVFFEGYDVCQSWALKKALMTPRSNWMNGICQADDVIQVINKVWRVEGRDLSGDIPGLLAEEILFLREPSLKRIGSMEYNKGFRERIYLELDRLGYYYDETRGVVPNAERVLEAPV